MLFSAFILIELCNSEKDNVNLFSLSQKFLGNKAALFLRIIYTVLFIALIFAYLNKGGDVIASCIHNHRITSYTASILLAILGIGSVLVGKHTLDQSNRVVVVIMFIAYIFLILFNIPQKSGNMTHVDFSYLMTSIPFVIVTFGYHNMIPSIRKRFDITGQNLKTICIVGGLMTFMVYFLWVTKVLAVLPVHGANGIAEAYSQQKLSSEVLLQIVNNVYFFYAIQVFCFLAIFTSLIGQSVSLTDFLLDSFNKKGNGLEKLIISGLVSLIALIFIHLYPQLFYTLLELCGGIFAVTIFCIYPSLIFLKARKSCPLNRRYIPMVYLVLASGSGIIAYEIFKYFLALI
jgi:tyrosine-specific transport protein